MKSHKTSSLVLVILFRYFHLYLVKIKKKSLLLPYIVYCHPIEYHNDGCNTVTHMKFSYIFGITKHAQVAL